MATRYKTPIVGTILPAKQNTTITNPGPVHDPSGLNQWLQAQAQDQAAQMTARAADEYQFYFRNSWLLNYEAGRLIGPRGQGDPDALPPEPPRAFVVIVAAAEAGGIAFQVIPGEQRACNVPTYARIPAPAHYTQD